MAEIMADARRGRASTIGRRGERDLAPLLPPAAPANLRIELLSPLPNAQPSAELADAQQAEPSSLSDRQSGKRLRRPARTSAPFDSLTRDSLVHFNSIGLALKQPSGSIVFREGERADGVYFVRAGQVKLFARSQDGHTMIVKIATPGDVLGLSATLNGLPHEVTTETLVPCEFKYIDEGVFLDFLKRYSEAGYAAALTLAREHREVFLKARRLALTPSANARISQVLVEFAIPGGNSPHSFPMVLTHAELASMAGTSRETVTRLLNEFERDGIISRDHATITILRSAELQQLAH